MDAHSQEKDKNYMIIKRRMQVFEDDMKEIERKRKTIVK